MNKINILLVLLALTFAGCSGNNSTSSEGDSSTTMSSSISVIPGMSSSSTVVASKSPISLYNMRGLAKKNIDVTKTMSAIPYNVDLDTIYGTSGFSFLIKNNGTSDITGLKFEFDLDYFKVTPDSIITLGSPSTSTGIEQLIKVTVEHGTLASGYGFTNVLTGNQYGTLTISGHNDDGDFSVTYTMHVYAKRMIINIDIPDTLVNNVGSSMYLNSRNEALSLRHAHVDPSSEDCYLNLGELTLDTSSNLHMVDMEDYYDNFIANKDLNTMYDVRDNRNEFTTTASDHAKFLNELNTAKRLETYKFMDNNCVVLVNDNWPVTNGNAQDMVRTGWVTTQRIID